MEKHEPLSLSLTTSCSKAESARHSSRLNGQMQLAYDFTLADRDFLRPRSENERLILHPRKNRRRQHERSMGVRFTDEHAVFRQAESVDERTFCRIYQGLYGRRPPSSQRRALECVYKGRHCEKGDSLDIGLIADESLSVYENLPDPIDSAEEAVEKLELAISLLNEVIAELKAVEQPNSYQATNEVLKVAETSEVLKK